MRGHGEFREGGSGAFLYPASNTVLTRLLRSLRLLLPAKPLAHHCVCVSYCVCVGRLADLSALLLSFICLCSFFFPQLWNKVFTWNTVPWHRYFTPSSTFFFVTLAEKRTKKASVRKNTSVSHAHFNSLRRTTQTAWQKKKRKSVILLVLFCVEVRKHRGCGVTPALWSALAQTTQSG